MKSILPALAVLFASTIAFAAPPAAVQVTAAYSHPTPAPGVPGVGFFTLTNTGKQADRLLSAESPAAGRIEIHQTRMEKGVMQMRGVSEGVALPAGQAVTFAPGGLHLMLFALRAPLREGEKVPLTLVFERQGRVSTELLVKPREDAAAAADDHAHHDHH